MIYNRLSQEFKDYVNSFSPSRTLIPITCPICKKTFYKSKNQIIGDIYRGRDIETCSRACLGKSQQTSITKPCLQCGKPVTKQVSQIKKAPNFFCNHSCSASYNNTHKATGTRRSKLEIWLEEKLQTLYPNLDFLFNDKTTINSELDIYLPKYKLAFELNGIFHYEPIFGDDKLNKIQNNDANKFQLCQQNEISLCIIDTSWIKYNKESNFQKILDIITNILLRKMVAQA